jgi:hypothetical protein
MKTYKQKTLAKLLLLEYTRCSINQERNCKMTDADQFVAQDTAHDLCEVDCGQLRHGVFCSAMPADHDPEDMWCSCRRCCCANGMCTHQE